MSTRQRWGKAGQRISPGQATRADAQAAQQRENGRFARVLAGQRLKRDWAAGLLVPHRITLALDLAKLDGPEVDRACGAEEPAVDMWEAGTLYPTWDQLLALADLCGVPAGFFTIVPSAKLPIETSLRFHRKDAAYRQPPPVLFFTPEAIEAATKTKPKELPS